MSHLHDAYQPKTLETFLFPSYVLHFLPTPAINHTIFFPMDINTILLLDALVATLLSICAA
jgi:hypothetical protein